MSDKVFCHITDENLLWKGNVFIDNFGEIANLSDSKGTGSKEHLKSQNTNAPNIDFAVIKLVLHNLRSSINWSSTLSISKHSRVNCPSKVAKLHGVLVK